jgi:hypothetical protein
MFLAGHMGIAVFLGRFFRLSPALAALGALIPDLIDKPLPYIFGIGYTKFVGHTLLLCALLYILPALANRRAAGASLAFGAMSHLVFDFGGVLWFYPFVEYGLATNLDTFLYYFQSPLGFFGDLLGLGLLLATRQYYYSFPHLVLGWPVRVELPFKKKP